MGDFAYILFTIGAAAIIGGIVLLRKKRPIKLYAPAIAIGAVLIIASVPSIMAEIDKQEHAEQAAKEESAKAEKEKKEAEEAVAQAMPTEDKIEKVIFDTLGDKNNDKQNRIKEVQVFGDVANLLLNADENLSVDFTKKGMWKDTFKALEKLANIEEITIYSFVWHLPLTDKHGNTEYGKVMTLDFPREVTDKIDFGNVDYNNATDISENYWEHNALK